MKRSGRKRTIASQIGWLFVWSAHEPKATLWTTEASSSGPEAARSGLQMRAERAAATILLR